jgi:hypothetical protein
MRRHLLLAAAATLTATAPVTLPADPAPATVPVVAVQDTTAQTVQRDVTAARARLAVPAPKPKPAAAPKPHLEPQHQHVRAVKALALRRPAPEPQAPRPEHTHVRHAARAHTPVGSVTGSPQAAARAVFGAQYGCAAQLITRESGWNVHARNPSSGAYGLPQALPGSKMATAGADWRTNPVTQLRWMRSYVAARYGGACAALAHSHATGWY